MDQLDFAIIASLERDGRQSFSGLAESVGLSKTPCWNRVQALEAAGVIRGYTADVDPKAIGLGVFAFVQVMIDFHAARHSRPPFCKMLQFWNATRPPARQIMC